MNAGTLAKLGRTIVAKIDAKKTRGLGDDLEAFVRGMAGLDGRISSPFAPSPARWSASDLASISKYVAIELRNTLEGDRPTSVPELPECSSALEALQKRLDVVATSDFNVFVEMVATYTNEKRQVVPVIQAPIHRKWTKICDDPANERVIIISHNDAGKSQQLAILRPLWDLGRDQTLKSVILTNVTAGAISRIRAIADYMTLNEDVKRIFPNLKPDPNGPWNTTQLRVVRPGIEKEPSLEAFGIKGAILGSRVDRIYADDVLDSENTATPKQIEDLRRWWEANIETRLTGGCRMILIGTPWVKTDLLHTLEANTIDNKVWRFPILDSDGNPTWPEHWPHARIEQRRRTLNPLEFARSMMTTCRSDDSSAFKVADIEAAIARGDGHPFGCLVGGRLADLPRGLPEGAKLFIGVDLAVSQKRAADNSAIYVLLFEKNGGRFTTLSVEAGKWTPDDLIEKLWDHEERFPGAAIWVESNGAQVFFVSQARARGLKIQEFVTSGSNKYDVLSGVEAQATPMKNALWIIPSKAGQTSPEISAWVKELLFFDRDKHAGDRLMAGWIAFASAMAYASIRPPAPMVNVRIIGADGDEVQIERDRQARREARRLEEARIAALPLPPDTMRKKAHEANDLTRGRPDAGRFPGSALHRAFDVDDGGEGTGQDELNARAARRDGAEDRGSAKRSVARLMGGTIGNDNDDDRAVPMGHWRNGGWTGGGVL